MSKGSKFSNKRRVRANTTKYYNMLIVGTIVLAFLLIAVLYLKILYDLFVYEKINFMTQAADTMIAELQENNNAHENISSNAQNQLEVIAKLTDTTIWIMKPNGNLMFVSDIPPSALDSIVYIQDQGYFMSDRPQILSGLETGVTLRGGNFFGVFSETSGDWLSVVRPLVDDQGGNWASLLIFYPTAAFSLSSMNVLIGLGFILVLALVVATVIVKGYVSRMAEPIDILSEAANRVAQGDLDTRVHMDWDDDYAIGSQQQEDDWSNLVITFNRMIEQIQRQNRDQRDFIASVSHDLRTPLTSISGFVTAMLDGTIPPELHEKYLTTVHEETKRLSSLVQDMNTMITLEQDPEDLEMTKFNVTEVIARVIDSMEVLLLTKNISVQTNVRPIQGEEIMIMANEKQIERVLHNLISNAIKFVNEYGIISIRTEKVGKNRVRIEVEDNGPGITQEDLPFIFDRFFKSDRSRTGRKGSGLGLYICKKILQAHGQSIFASKSQLGGAKFEFTLPLA